jgi:hypothetical protein
MIRLRQLAFLFSVAGLCWLSMLATHELGHIVAARATGGRVTKVVLHPLAISRTDVMPNPAPLIVVWAGPVLGVLLPMALSCLPTGSVSRRNLLRFFTGFCLVANGAYIGLGSFNRIGDAGEMLRHGSPMWTLQFFGVLAISAGLLLWHRLGSLKDFLAQPELVSPTLTRTVTLFLIAMFVVECLLFARL